MKPIKLNETEINKILEEFKNKLLKNKMADGKLNITQEYGYKDPGRKAQLIITTECFEKMLYLLLTNDDEIGWHFLTKKEEDNFICYDIKVYPQTVTSVTVDTDQEEYEKWFNEQPDEVVCNMKGHCHSHVKMATNPSGRDLGDQEKIVKQLTSDSYYIFMIVNKNLNYWIRIYDMTKNIMYDSEDIDVVIEHIPEFISDIDGKVKKQKTYTWNQKTSTSTKTGTQKKEEDDDYISPWGSQFYNY